MVLSSKEKQRNNEDGDETVDYCKLTKSPPSTRRLEPVQYRERSWRMLRNARKGNSESAVDFRLKTTSRSEKTNRCEEDGRSSDIVG